MKEEITEEQEQIIVTDPGQEIEPLLPQMNVNVPAIPDEDVSKLISDETLVGLYDEILNDLRKKDDEYSGYLSRFVDMVINEGDSTSSSKEALVGLAKIISDIPGQKAKIADLMTRIKLKERDTFPRYLAAKQQNTIHIGESGVKREILKQIELQQKRAKNGTQ